MDKKKIDRINELARLKKERGLTVEEQGEQAALRREYIDEFKQNVHLTLRQVRIQNEDGTRSELKHEERRVDL
ncbi:MAG: DUF896 domain-containing protein [Clostridiales bacterium]|nr:DUF896 domain-containing protein [Clostridiales bacterium]